MNNILSVTPINYTIMKTALISFLLLMANVVTGQSLSTINNSNVDSFLNARQTAPIGKPFPSFTVITGLDTVSNKAFEGKIVLLNFWFEGCHPCMAEMKALEELQQQMKDNKSFLFVSFTSDNPETIKRVKEEYGITFPVLSKNENECSKLIFRNAFPTSIILDRKGTIKYFHSGGTTNSEEARDFIMNTLLPEVKSEL